MPINFRAMMSAESQRKWAYSDATKAELEGLSDAEFAARFEYYLKNADLDRGRWHPGDPVYDAVIIHHMLPMVVERLRRLLAGEALEAARKAFRQ